MARRHRLIAGVLLTAGLLTAGTVTADTVTAERTASVTPTLAASSNPLAEVTKLGPDDVEALHGQIVERIQTGSYTYLLVEQTSGARTWSVMMGIGPAQGTLVRIDPIATKRDFYSARLDRVFPELMFGTISIPSTPHGDRA
ncbi:MAG: hypothetical protein AAGF11_53580 [Myxococcota bacterium]